MTDERHRSNQRIPTEHQEPGELLFEFVRADRVRVRFELRDHGERGCDVQIFLDDEFFAARRHSSRDLAIVWAVQEKTAFERSARLHHDIDER